MPFKRFVEIGKVALVNYGKNYEKLVVIVDASLNDFDRFKLMLAKIKRAGVVRQELAKFKKEVADWEIIFLIYDEQKLSGKGVIWHFLSIVKLAIQL
ncbi:hypothetical protein CQW23_01352 [Capsicum baccatum]|uniref:60S ribosomal protein L14 n=1 Tax=Capsicum baccatum TaxID=33114 RepID=A0A2G2XNF8_CAPBA|nr:hypothetical protein CQW23_01352 [Capsicum baccatum]